MKKTIKDIYQEVVNMTPEEKIKYARQASSEVIGYLSSSFNNPGGIYLMLIGTYVGSDGYIDQAEFSFCRSVFGFESSYEEFVKIVRLACKPSSIESIDKLIDRAPKEVKAAFVLLGVAICACNDAITVDEQQLLAKYID